MKSMDRLPAFPEAVMKVWDSHSTDHHSMSELCPVIRFNQFLAATILKINNAGYFNSGSPIKTIGDAAACPGKENLIRATT